MRRILLLGLTMAALLAPAGAHAAPTTLCRDKIYNEWYSTGKIHTNYPRACYEDALKHVPADAQVYSNLSGDIKAAMQASIEHPHGGGPAEVGSGSTTPTGPGAVKGGDVTNPDHKLSVAPLSSPSSGGGVPTPILVLGGIAIALALAGLVGTGVQFARKRRAA